MAIGATFDQVMLKMAYLSAAEDSRRWLRKNQGLSDDSDTVAFQEEFDRWLELQGWRCAVFKFELENARCELVAEEETAFHELIVQFLCSLFVPSDSAMLPPSGSCKQAHRVMLTMTVGQWPTTPHPSPRCAPPWRWVVAGGPVALPKNSIYASGRVVMWTKLLPDVTSCFCQRQPKFFARD